MKHLVYAMQFNGTADPVDGDPKRLKVHGAGASCNIVTLVTAEGVDTILHDVEGGNAAFFSEVYQHEDGAFEEQGTIDFGNDNRIYFKSVGPGRIVEQPSDELRQGGVLWRIEKGEGQFKQATGLITSNFTLSTQGHVVDHQFGVIYFHQGREGAQGPGAA